MTLGSTAKQFFGSDPDRSLGASASSKRLVSRWGIALVVLTLVSTISLASGKVGNGNADQPIPEIIGGVPSPDGAYPWMVAILLRGTALGGDIFNAQFCAGTLIAPRWVLSAAHCYADDDGNQNTFAGNLLVMVGENDLSPGPMLYEIERVILHEDFDTGNNALTNDIALLQLRQAVPMETLPLNDREDNPLAAPGRTARIAGWGSRMWDDNAGQPFDFPVSLHEADLPLISNQECAVALSEVGINDTHLCAGILGQGGVDTCAADSGGPIFVSDGQGGFLQVGITSFGIGCGLPNRPGVYTRLSSFTEWIANIVGLGVIVPHWGNGQGLVTDLIVYNTSKTTATESEITFRDGDGNEVPMGTILAGTMVQETAQGVVLDGNRLQLPPLGIHTISTTGVGPVVSGSISLTSDGSIGAAIRFALAGIGIAGVGLAEPAIDLIAPARRAGSLNTGVAIHNPGSEEVTVDVTLKGPDGQEVPNGRTELTLPALGQVARFITDLFPTANTANFQGSICLSARTGRIAAVALELGNRPGEFTTLPVSVTRE